VGHQSGGELARARGVVGGLLRDLELRPPHSSVRRESGAAVALHFPAATIAPRGNRGAATVPSAGTPQLLRPLLPKPTLIRRMPSVAAHRDCIAR
jgi:hypothetical protein